MNFSNRMAHLDAVGINGAEQRRFSQKLFSYLTMRFQAAKKSDALGQSREKINPILLNPTVKSVLRRAFQSEQQSKRDKFANGKFGLKMFLRFIQHIVYTIKSSMINCSLVTAIVYFFVVFGHLHNIKFSAPFSASNNG